MGKNAKKKSNRNTKRPKKSYQTIDDGDEKSSLGRRNRNNRYGNDKNKSNQDFDDEYTKLRKTLLTDGLEIADMSPDGNCLFRSLSDQLFGDYGSAHYDVRSAVCDFMEKNEGDFRLFLVFEDEDDEDQDEEDARDFEHYIENMRQEGEWGGNLEVVAAARLYQRTITVYSESLAAFTIDHGDSKAMGSDLLVSYHDNDHYNSVRNKLHPPKPLRLKPPPSNDQVGIQSKCDEHISQEQSEIEKVTTSLSKSLISTELEKPEISFQKNVKRSAPCPCGSGLRYKKCCLAKQKLAKRVDRLKERRQHEDKDFSEANKDRGSQEIFRIVTI